MRDGSPDFDWLKACLAAIRETRVAVLGDLCLDAYWLIADDESELSVETGLPVRRVEGQRYSPGGAANVAVNLAVLGIAQVRALGVVGEDVFGERLCALLRERNVNCDGIVRSQADWQTLVFAKPHVGGREMNRIDFGGFNHLASETADLLAERLEQAAAQSDVVILNQQVPSGTSPPEMIARLNEMAARHADIPFVADSRHRPELYKGCMLKLNAHEAARIAGSPCPLHQPIPDAAAREHARKLYERIKRAVFVTRGAEGILVADASGLHESAGVPHSGPSDPVGAGDTAVAAIAGVLGSGGDAVTAARLANLAAAVTVRKLQQTGAPTADEIRGIAEPLAQGE